MTAGDAAERLSFLGKKLPERFALREILIEAGCERSYARREWAGAMIVVEAGELEVECLEGTCSRFGEGAVLYFDTLPIRTLRNRGDGGLILSVISRRDPPPDLP